MSEARRTADGRLAAELRQLQDDLVESWIDRSLPEDWQGLDTRAPLPRAREKVTLRLDADMIKWFRRLGPGYGLRINMVLRIYWEALLAGRIKAHWDEPDVAPQFLDMVERLAGNAQDPDT